MGTPFDAASAIIFTAEIPVPFWPPKNRSGKTCSYADCRDPKSLVYPIARFVLLSGSTTVDTENPMSIVTPGNDIFVGVPKTNSTRADVEKVPNEGLLYSTTPDAAAEIRDAA